MDVIKNKEKEILAELSEQEKQDLFQLFSKTMDSLISSEALELEKLKQEQISIKLEIEDLREVEKRVGYSSFLMDKKNKKLLEETIISRKIENQQNVLLCVQSGGSYLTIKNQYDESFEKVPDFRKVDSTNFIFNESDVLEIKRPSYVPFVNEKNLLNKKFVIDSIRLTEDTYLISNYAYNQKERKDNFFTILTLDQLVLTIDYYYTKAKAVVKQNAKEQNERNKARYFALSEEKRRGYMFQRGIYRSLSAKSKKEVSESEWEDLDLEDREKYYLPIATTTGKRVSIELESDTMPASFHRMYEDFIDVKAIFTDKDGLLDRKGRYANPIVFAYFRAYREMLNYKIKDIRIQREDYSDTYKQAIETSFGESNTSLILKDKYGILIKRQNGDEINSFETEQIENAWINISKVYGNLKPNADKYNLKISHSGLKLIFAMKALGVYIPTMGTIGVSNKLGSVDFESTFSHEVAHFIDNFIGELKGKRFATDDYESTAGKLAFTFRNSMNKPKNLQTDYINATKECFARCMQQYFSMKIYGEGAVTKNIDLTKYPEGVEFVNAENFVNLQKFNQDLLPLIELFFSENEDVFRTTIDLDGTNDIIPIESEEPIETDSQDDIKELIETLSMLPETDDLRELIETLKLLI